MVDAILRLNELFEEMPDELYGEALDRCIKAAGLQGPPIFVATFKELTGRGNRDRYI